MALVDLQLPTPLLKPDAWKKSSRDAVLSIAQVTLGGPFDAPWSHAQHIAVPVDFWRRAVAQSGSLGVVTADRLRRIATPIEIVSRVELPADERADWKKLIRSAQFQVRPELHDIRLSDWAREVFPSSFIEAGEPVWRKYLIDYENQIAPTFVSMDALRFLPGFLKSQKAAFAQSAAREWAYAQTLFSPQDDRQGQGETALLNPTLNIVEDGKSLKAFWRSAGRVQEADLNWKEAAVVDELRETPRIPFTQLKAELEAGNFPFKEKPDFAKTLSDLAQRGLILRR